MKQSPLEPGSYLIASRRRAQGSIRVVILVVIAFLLGLAAGAWWFFRATKTAETVEIVHEAAPGLSGGTKAVIQSLNAPVGIRFYALLDPASVPVPMQQFAGRAEQLLSMYERESNGRITVTRYNSMSNAAASAASADKLKPFNLDKGDACYLGLTVVCQDQKETIPFLFPEWEQALESDLTRAIVRVASAKPLPGRAVEAPQADLATVEEIKRSILDMASTSVEQGTQILRQKALTAFMAAAQEMEAQVKVAQQGVLEARSNGSEAAQQAAIKNLQQVQAAQTEKLKQITARLQAQITALEQIKAK